MQLYSGSQLYTRNYGKIPYLPPDDLYGSHHLRAKISVSSISELSFRYIVGELIEQLIMINKLFFSYSSTALWNRSICILSGFLAAIYKVVLETIHRHCTESRATKMAIVL